MCFYLVWLNGSTEATKSTFHLSQILFLELKLPPNGDVNGVKNKKTLGYTRRAGARIKLSKQFSTTKACITVMLSCQNLWDLLSKWTFTSVQDVLEKLKPLHRLPGVILEWRRITNALTKVVFPLQREKKWNSQLKMDRIHPISQSHTATGAELEERTLKERLEMFNFVYLNEFIVSHRAGELHRTQYSERSKGL